MSESFISSNTALGAVIRAGRKRLRLSQEELGAPIGVHQTTISAIENGSSNVRLDTLLRILSVLELELIVQEKKKAVCEPDAEW